jgi:putative tricarboxylic transport membrane protein
VRAPQDFAAGVCLLALAVFALWAGADLPAGRLRAMGPGMLPRAIAILVGLLGVGLVVYSLVKRGSGLERLGIRGPVFVTLGVVAFALTIRTVGLAVAGPLVVVVSSAASAETRVREIVVFAVAITALCIGLFRFALHLPIPVLVLPGIVTI